MTDIKLAGIDSYHKHMETGTNLQLQQRAVTLSQAGGDFNSLGSRCYRTQPKQYVKKHLSGSEEFLFILFHFFNTAIATAPTAEYPNIAIMSEVTRSGPFRRSSLQLSHLTAR